MSAPREDSRPELEGECSALEGEKTESQETSKPYRILSFDGGGIRALLSAVILEQLTERVDCDWIGKADLIAGTSAGGMVALGLANDLTPTQVRSLFYDRGPIMFEDSLADDLWNLGGLTGAEYSTRNRREVLEDIFGDDVLGDYDPKRVLISTVDLHDRKKGYWKAKFFHNFEPAKSSEDAKTDREARVSDVALYTSAAPTLFPSVDGYVDGGLVANNPSMAALAQSRDTDYKGIAEELDHVRLLSISTGRNPDRIEGEEHDWGYLQWSRYWLNLVDAGLVGVADYQCRQMLGKERYHRIEHDYREGQSVGLVEYEKRDLLVEIGERMMDGELKKAVDWIEKVWIPDGISAEAEAPAVEAPPGAV